MDDMTFDGWAKALAAMPSRRAALGLAAGGVLGGLARLFGSSEVDGKGKKGGKKQGSAQRGGAKKKKKGRQPQRGEFCGDRFCAPGKRCCGEECVDPRECCTSNRDCNACSVCHIGRCVPDRARNGQKCSGCLECVNGACGVPNDEFCSDDQRCRSSTGLCCPRCLDDQCCPAGSACINPGIFSPNSCCDLSQNKACGDNGDGTFRECGSNFNEECVNGECVPKDQACPNGQPVCGGRCCAANEECCGDVCMTQGSATCTKDGWCPATSGQACCGTGDCAEDPCCLFAAGEACCVSSLTGETTCCPGGHGQCAPGGCCPAGTAWTSDGGCDACCPNGNSGCEGCVAPLSGRG